MLKQLFLEHIVFHFIQHICGALTVYQKWKSFRWFIYIYVLIIDSENMVVMVLTVPASGDTRYFQLLGSQEQLFIHFVIIVMTRDCILCVSVCVCWGGGYPCFVFYYFSVPLYLNGLQCLKYSSKFGRYTQLNSQHRDYSGQYWKWYMSLK